MQKELRMRRYRERMLRKQRKAALQQELLDWFERRRRKKEQLQQELMDLLRRCCGGGGVDEFARVRELVEVKRVDVNWDYNCGYTSLILTAPWGGRMQVQLAQLFLDNGAKVDAMIHIHQTALDFAVVSNHVPMARLLLQYGAKIMPVRPTRGDLLLGRAIQLHGRRSLEMVTLLLQYGAPTDEHVDATPHGDDGITLSALHCACRVPEVEIVQLLLNQRGVEINAIQNGYLYDANCRLKNEKSAMSPLCRACLHSHTEIARLLVLNGARVIYKRLYPNGPSPLVHAITHHTSLELVRFLLENMDVGLLPVAGPHSLSPPLYRAIKRNNVEALQLLINYGANITTDKPFLWHCAKRVGLSKERLESCRVLLRAGANVNLPDPESGETPLWVAAKNGHLELVQDFLKAGANVSIRDNNNETPLGVAYRQGHLSIVYLLLRTSPHVWSNLESALL